MDVKKSGSEQTDWERHGRGHRLLRYAFTLIVLITITVSWQLLGIRYNFVEELPREITDVVNRMYPPDYGYAPEIISPLVETINISIVGTGLGIVLSIPVAYIAASNTSPNVVTYSLGKLIVTVTRSVNTVIIALILVAIFGPGVLAGVLAIGIRSVGFIGKLLAEEIEEIERSQQEAIRATGANELEVILYGIVPQIKPGFIAVSIFRWEINVRGATILGFVGAGGIGVNLLTQISRFNWDAAAVILIAIAGVVFVSEFVGWYLRKKVN